MSRVLSGTAFAAAALAIAALVAAGFGLVLPILGPLGAGVSAAVGLVAIQTVLYAIVAVADGGDLFVGCWLLLSFVIVAAVCLLRDTRGRVYVGIREGLFVCETCAAIPRSR